MKMETLELFSISELKDLIRQIVKDEIEIQGRKPFMDITEAAKYLGITINTMYAWNKEKRISYYKPDGKKNYYKLEDLEHYVLNNKHRVKSHEEFKTEMTTQMVLKQLKKKK